MQNADKQCAMLNVATDEVTGCVCVEKEEEVVEVARMGKNGLSRVVCTSSVDNCIHSFTLIHSISLSLSHPI